MFLFIYLIYPYFIFIGFWATVCKTVRHMLSDRCPVSLSVSLWRWCISAKWLDRSSWNLAWR